ncbi:MAG: hypothetical protein RIR18_2227 [Pseudomonadota bacterium]|jgi:hypothetical protein
MPFKSLTTILKAAAGILWFLGLVFAFASMTDFNVSLKDGLFERTLQSKLPVKTSVRGVATVRIEQVFVGKGPELQVVFKGVIADNRSYSPYVLELAYRVELENNGLVVVPFMPDQKIDGHDFTVAQEVLPSLFEVMATKPFHVIKKTHLIGMHVSEVLVKDERLKVTLSGYSAPELGIAIILALLGGLAWRQSGKVQTAQADLAQDSD